MALPVFRNVNREAYGRRLQPLSANLPNFAECVGTQFPDDFLIPFKRRMNSLE